MSINNRDFAPVMGIRLGSAAAGIKYPDRADLVVIELPLGTTSAALFTRNAFCAAPVVVARRNLGVRPPHYLLINSGNANAGTGDQGMEDAEACCEGLAEIVDCQASQVLPFSTGVIGEPLPVSRLVDALPQAINSLTEDGWVTAANAIMTTDTVPKLASRQFLVDGMPTTVTGMAKGSGMIRPDMATMLAFIATDAIITPKLLRECLQQAVEPSFNAITVDGDTSTNDACVLVASGMAPTTPISDAKSVAYQKFCTAVAEVCMDLARAIVRDGEGATKLVEILVEEADSSAEAKDVAYTVAHSPLVKTALFAADPNWGRIMAAVGRAGIEDLDIQNVAIWLDDTCVVCNGARAEEYTEAAGQAVMDQSEFVIRIVLGRGEAESRVLTCDLSYDYVRINAEYRT